MRGRHPLVATRQSLAFTISMEVDMDKGEPIPVPEEGSMEAGHDRPAIVEVAPETGERGIAEDVAELLGDVSDPMTEGDDTTV